MIRHLLKLVWHRKRANALVMAEIFLSFLIVFAVVTMTVSLWSRWGTPLGFSWNDVWMMEIDSPLRQEVSSSQTTGDIPEKEISEARQEAMTTEYVLRELKAFPEIEFAAADSMTPYSDNSWTTAFQLNNRQVAVTADQATDDFARVMRIPILKGRWFSAEDDGQSYLPIVIDRDAAKAMFDDDEPIGKTFSNENFTDDKTIKGFRVVGVIAPFRKDGEFSDTSIKMVFMRTSFEKPMPPATNRIVIRVRPGTPASFEAELNRRLRPNASGLSFHIRRMEEMRNSALRFRFIPIIILGLIGTFLILMVALGLTGVLWQTVTRRMREMGLRRALGASGRAVRFQVLGEVALIASLAVALGVIVVAQLPLLGLFRVVTVADFSTGFASALAVIYTITLLCGAYPSWLASTIDPADALRYE